jgi:hypothetical protein
VKQPIPLKPLLDITQYARESTRKFISHDEDHKTRQALPKSSYILSSLSASRVLLTSFKDTLDLFATLIVSLELSTHKQFFRTFPNSFTTYVLHQNYLPLLPTLSPPIVMRRHKTWHLSSSRSRIVGRIQESLHELLQLRLQQRSP